VIWAAFPPTELTRKAHCGRANRGIFFFMCAPAAGRYVFSARSTAVTCQVGFGREYFIVSFRARAAGRPCWACRSRCGVVVPGAYARPVVHHLQGVMKSGRWDPAHGHCRDGSARIPGGRPPCSPRSCRPDPPLRRRGPGLPRSSGEHAPELAMGLLAGGLRPFERPCPGNPSIPRPLEMSAGARVAACGPLDLLRAHAGIVGEKKKRPACRCRAFR